MLDIFNNFDTFDAVFILYRTFSIRCASVCCACE